MRAPVFASALALIFAPPWARAQSLPELPSQAPVPEPSPRKGPLTYRGQTSVSPKQSKVRDPSPLPASPSGALPENDAEKEATRTGTPPQPDLACERALDRLGVKYERLPPIAGTGQCGVGVPYNVSEPASGVALTPGTQITCSAALALARWIKNTVVPAAGALGEGVRLAEISHSATYFCRARNGAPNGQPSEHATDAAIGIHAFSFVNHENVSVTPRTGEGTMVKAFQKAVRAGACLYFTTVLGPGSDKYHSDHLHLDVKGREGGFRLCQ